MIGCVALSSERRVGVRAQALGQAVWIAPAQSRDRDLWGDRPDTLPQQDRVVPSNRRLGNQARQGKARQGKATQRNATQRNATITPTLGKLFEHLRTNDIRMITVPKVEAPILAQRFVNHDPHRTWKGAPRLHRALDKSLTATMNRQR